MKKPQVLRNPQDFAALYSKGKSAGSKYVVVIFRSNGLDHNRKAFVASKKVGGSVQRNRARRLMREACRQLELPIPQGTDILFIARQGIAESKCADVKKSIEAAIRRSGLIG